ncbi:MAG TPA: esterase [Flavobacteriaceae bacterium]|nr:esterase [Flavobacteriaceae bacterium]HAT63862.1 esterase [Flavobacteriaceae bacterium]|tara:strand:- start:58397 stop:59251 length:855 start_codon:yes stop_codon:yes gene_type:complete
MKKSVIFVFLFLIAFSLQSCKEEIQKSESIVQDETITSTLLKRTLPYKIYLPEAYQDSTKSFPIVYLLHGHGGDEKDWFIEDEGNIKVFLDSLIQHKIIPPIIAVTAHAGNSWYINRPEPMESFYLDEFIPFIEATYRVDTAQGRIAAGDSAGGYGALRFSLLRPELFQNVILLSPASYEPLPPAISSSRKVAAFAKNGVFNDSIWKSFSYTHRWENIKKAPKKPKYYLSVGDDDAYNIVPVITSLQQQMLQDSIPNELRITNGGHDWNCWQQNFSNALTAIFK